jgi:hypothetical protein
MTYQPAVGDRVRVTQVHEGEVTNANEIGFCLSSPDGRGIRRSYYYDPEGGRTLTNQTIEKLQDPEPRWVNGDVIRNKATGHTMLMNRSGTWVCSCRAVNSHAGATEPPEHVTGNWSAGNLEILHKADAA